METHGPSLIATIVISLAFAYAGGLAARMLGISKLVGYLIAGILVGPYTPGFVADPKLTHELSEIGVALLMFKVGLHFSLRDLVAVWHIAVPGAILQICLATGLGWGVGILLGWPFAASGILGLAVAISSTAVATRALEEQGHLGNDVGRITLGWLVVQDIVVIIALVVLPVIAAEVTNWHALGLLTGKTILLTALFVAVLLGIGRWLLPALLGWTARVGSQELFTLGVIVIALGVAYGSAVLMGVSLALGAFFAGMVLGESELSHQAAADSLPVQNIFTVLFFVSVGVLFDPMLVLKAPVQIAALVVAIIVGGGMIFFGTLLTLGVAARRVGEIAGTLAQVGEFSFVLSSAALGLALLHSDQQGVLLAAALISILLHSLTIKGYQALGQRLQKISFLQGRTRTANISRVDTRAMALRNHVIVVGHGRVGSVIAKALRQADLPFIVVEGNWRIAEAVRASGTQVVFGDATRPDVFKAARPRHARLIVVALPDAFQSRRVIELARELSPEIEIAARAHSEEEYSYLREFGCQWVVTGEHEIALSMSNYALRHMGLDGAATQALVEALRERR